MINLSFQTLIIILLVTFIIGMIFGVSLARPRGSYQGSEPPSDKSDEISIKFTREQLEKRKRQDDGKEVLDFSKWNPPSDSEIKIDWDKISRDLEKKSKNKYD